MTSDQTLRPVFKIWIITLFPEYFDPLLNCGVTSKVWDSKRDKLFELNLVQLRDYSLDSYKGVDDSPFGGGPGMVMRADILKNALFLGVVEAGGYGDSYKDKLHVICPSPRGKLWDNQSCMSFAERFWQKPAKDLVFICGRYEGIDERFIQNYVDEEISVGDFVLTGGELAVLTIIDSAIRFVDGVLGNQLSTVCESFQGGLLEAPQYTRPQTFENQVVPDVLLSGHHKKIEEYRQKQRENITKKFRPDLFKNVGKK
ncbi:MAG: tRNA (guanosine(37)-N1)-methyltransferase TrmD [Bacteriovoracaceae bacterium]|nr:tRNA (guanosine(37)-N1)-methyltransferase TrmD [Bacteriovoracaceae bacterium]